MHSSHLPENPNLNIDYSNKALKEIWLAGGCFWGVEAYVRRIPGVALTKVGYANGKTRNPTYEEVCHDGTGHAETVYVQYDPDRIPLVSLLEKFFGIIDPLSRNRQGGDSGLQYRTGIYYNDPDEMAVIHAFIEKEQQKYSKPILTEVEPLAAFYPAEEYHQSYLEKNPNGYCHIKF